MTASVARRRAVRLAAAGVAALAAVAAPGTQAAASPSPTVIASGLDNPRGLTFGPEGAPRRAAVAVAPAYRDRRAATSVSALPER